jgi:hypothetical protein
MRGRGLCALALLAFVLVAGPAVALAGPPATWPSAADLRKAEPGIRPGPAACMARYYRGRLTRVLWFTPYYKLDVAQKRVTDVAYARCMTRAQRVASIQGDLASAFGKHPELSCVANGMELESRSPARFGITSRVKESKLYDGIFRGCRFMGVLYATIGRNAKLILTPSEQRCVNRLGSSDPVTQKATKTTMTAVGTVFDHCVGHASEGAMWRRVFSKFKPARAIPCIAEHSIAITFVDFLTQSATAKSEVTAAVAACVAPTPK